MWCIFEISFCCNLDIKTFRLHKSNRKSSNLQTGLLRSWIQAKKLKQNMGSFFYGLRVCVAYFLIFQYSFSCHLSTKEGSLFCLSPPESQIAVIPLTFEESPKFFFEKLKSGLKVFKNHITLIYTYCVRLIKY